MKKGFFTFSKENGLVESGDRILVGVSGGIDSVVLLDILVKIQRKMKLKIAVAHVNYGLRKESDRDNKFVKELSGKYCFPFFEKKVKLAGSNIEEKARDIRYGFFNEIAKCEGFNKIAVAHHKNDLVETFFLNLVRGSGLTGLVSMKQKNGNLVRPLLFATRKEIEEYAKENKLKYVEDVTNKDLTIKRNLVRHRIIPEFEKMNPDFVETISSEIQTLREVNDIISDITTNHYKKLAKETENSVELSVKYLCTLHPYLQSEIIRKSLLHAKGDLRDISRKNIEDILKLTKKPFGTKKVHLPGCLLAERTYDKIVLEKEGFTISETQKEVVLEAGRKVFFGKWCFFLEKKAKFSQKEDENLVYIDIQKAGDLLVRCRLDGDRVDLREGKTKKLQDVFVDAKVPQKERKTYPIIVNKENKVIMIPFLRTNPLFRASKESKNIASIQVTKGE